MTVRDATRRESPDGHVLYIEDLRQHLGVGTSAGEGSSTENAPKARPEVVLIGHDMHGDFQNLEREGINLQTSFHYSGCLDTAVIIEDTATYRGKSLSSLVSHYDLAEMEWKNPGCAKVPGKYSFKGSHCAGNDAVKTHELSLAQPLDLTVRTRYRKSLNDPNPPTDWLDKPLNTLNPNLILLSYDTESVENPRYKPQVPNRTSEHGFAWLRLRDIAHLAPGENACNWRPFIRAQHWINQDFRNFQNSFYCVGNPLGFYTEYGKSQYYRVSEGPAKFHRMFEEIADLGAAGSGRGEGDEGVGGLATILEETTLVGSSADKQDDLSDEKGNHPLPRDVSVRGRGGFRGTRGLSNQGHITNRGGTLGNNSSSGRGRGNSRGRSRGNGRGNHNRGGFRGNSLGRTGAWRGDFTALG